MLKFFIIEPQNMLKVCLSKKVQKSKFHHLIHTWGKEVGKGYENEEILEYILSRLLRSLT